ncbi:MAG: hypothetical protein QG656_1532, partial [Candidatus Hydrogenedentes bacterium]|nr:hypothetical protein [Candidatus Hydrogenedentota bacterium]
LQALLTGHGYSVTLAVDGSEALAAARKNQPDIIITDILMPGMDGYSLCRQWKQDEKLKGIPLVFYTATYTDPKDEEFALSLGADRFILKPQEPQVLLDMIVEVIEEQRTGRLNPSHEAAIDETVYFKKYNETLIRKLEDKLVQLESANASLEREIAERKEAEEMLRKSEAELQCIFETPLHGVLAVDVHGKTIKVNRRFAEMWHISPSVLESKDKNLLLDCVQNQLIEPEVFIGKVQALYQSNEEIMDTVAFKDGRIYERYSTPLMMADSIIGRVWFFRDITEHRRVEDERARLAMAVESIPEAVIVTDTEGTIQYVNPAFEQITGYARSETIGNNPRMLKSGKQDDAFYKRLWETVAGGQVWSDRFVNKRKDGTLYDEEATISPVLDAAGHTTHYVGIKRDISDRIAAELRQQQAQKLEAVGTLAGGIAHDFNNILGIILGYGQMLLLDLPEDSPMREEVDQILAASERAKNLVRQILTFSRHGKEERQPLRLDLIVAEAVKFLRASIPSTILIRADVDRTCPMVLADPTQMHQILMNLCTNAYHAMQDQGGELNIDLKPFQVDSVFAETHPGLSEGAYVLLSVSDTGSGIDPSVMNRIFDPFFTTKPQGQGTGLGLATAHGIVSSHGGVISVYSELGKGSTFHVYLPSIESGADDAPLTDEPIRGGHENILVVDDEPALARALDATLKRFGYTVVALTNSAEALTLFRSQPRRFDLIVTDQTMPGMTGEALAKEILSLRPGMPIIISTGFSNHMTSEKAEQLGIAGFLMKPAQARQIAKLVREVLDKSLEKPS